MLKMEKSHQLKQEEELKAEKQTTDNRLVQSVELENKNNRSTRKRSKQGCITCKIRKKRCDEVKPICGDCRRLGRRCEYITDSMSHEEIKQLKNEMEIIERDSKTRRRKRKHGGEGEEEEEEEEEIEHGRDNSNDNDNNNEINGRIKGKIKKRNNKQDPDKIIFNPLAMDMATITNSAVFQNLVTQPPIISKKQMEMLSQATTTLNNGDGTNSDDLNKSSNTNSNNNNNINSNNCINNTRVEHISSLEDFNTMPDHNLWSSMQGLMSLSPNLLPSLSPRFSFHNDNNSSIINHETNVEAASPMQPLSLNGEENPIPLSELFSSGFSKLIQDHLKTEELSEIRSNISINSIANPNDEGVLCGSKVLTPISQLQELFEFSPRFQSIESPNLETKDISKSPRFVRNNSIITPSSPIQNFKSYEIYTNPSVVRNSTLASLTPMGKKLYQYYRDKLSYVVCSAPKQENMYLNTFLPMAHVDRSVLYGILAWSAFHLGGERMEKQSKYYIQEAVQNIMKRPILDDETEEEYSQICDAVEDDEEIIREEPQPGGEWDECAAVANLNKENMINMRLAAFLILCAVEICKGDVSRWSKYLTYGAKLIKLKGGLETFNESKDEHFLATNYAYHDITAVSVINERTLHFDLREYEEMWTKSNELGFADPLHGISSPVFKTLAEINKLIINVQKLIKRTKKDEEEFDLIENNKVIYSSGTDESPNSNDSKHYGLDEDDCWRINDEPESTMSYDDYFLSGVPSTVSDDWNDEYADKEVNLEDFDVLMTECQNIEQRLNTMKPKIVHSVNTKDLELQLTIFECFQITAKIHLRQSALRMNSASFEIQYLVNQLIKLLDVLLGSDVESCLCFPMFVAGMNSVRKKDKKEMTKRFEGFIKRYKWRNVLRCQVVTRHVWRLNFKGEKFVDWYAVVKKLGWDLSFA